MVNRFAWLTTSWQGLAHACVVGAVGYAHLEHLTNGLKFFFYLEVVPEVVMGMVVLGILVL